MRQLLKAMALLFLLGIPAGVVQSVQTIYVEHETEKQFKEGDPNGVLIGSQGELFLGRRSEMLLPEDGDLWLVNAMHRAADGVLYVATSGRGYIYRIAAGQEPQILYGQGPDDARHVFSLGQDQQGRLLAGTGGNKALLLRFGAAGPPEVLWQDDAVSYIWSIAVGPAGRIYLGTGPAGQVWTMDADGQNPRVLHAAREKNILCLALDSDGIVYAGGDENGLVYRIDPGSRQVRIVYETGHSEVSALVFDEQGNLYASTADTSAAKPGAKLILSDGETSRPEVQDQEEPGEQPDEGQPDAASDQAGPDDKPADRRDDAKVNEDAGLPPTDANPDSPDPESAGRGSSGPQIITASDPSDPQGTDEAPKPPAATPDDAAGRGPADEATTTKPAATAKDAARKLTPPATAPQQAGSSPSPGASPLRRPPSAPTRPPRPPAKENDVFQISPAGFVQKIFSQAVVILDMAYAGDGKLLLATGNEAKLLQLDVPRQEAVVLFESVDAVQVSSVRITPAGEIYAGLANPGGLVALQKEYLRTGYYDSEIIDAEQITRWGKIQLEADIPARGHIWVSTRSGNTSDPDNGGWSDWSPARSMETDLPVESEPGRFLQYRLTLTSFDGQDSPRIRRVKLAHMVPNLPPKLSEVEVKSAGAAKGGPPAKPGGNPTAEQNLTVSWKGEDPNKDKLRYKIYARPVGGQNWIRLAKDLDKSPYAWNTRTAADGYYEIRVEASDDLDNPSAAALSDSRISPPVAVDNSPPQVPELNWQLQDRTVKVTLRGQDALSVIQEVRYSVDSAEEWQLALASDGVYDSREETVELSADLKEPGEHLLALYIEDAQGNRAYRNVTIDVGQ
ncbi:MAG: hypothetical protein JW810_02400 [Sedimentisphaerales bacterium]|nr:hypothetical protein [Sedimentisphaerales bacterium]